MDPNETLRRIRQLTAEILGGEYSEDEQEQELAERERDLAELTEALDQWLSGGGMLPKGWVR